MGGIMAKEIVLALGGGGLRGIAHLGVLHCLEENGYKIKGIAGTSIGGMVGALYASGASLKEIDSIVDSFTKKPSYSRKSGDSSSLLGIGLIEELLREFFKDQLIENFPIKFVATAVNLDTEREVVLSKGKAVDATLATIAIPGILPAQKTEAGLLIDGGVLDPVPVGLARQLDPALPIVAVCLHKKNLQEMSEQTAFPFEGLVPKPLTQRFTRNRYYEAFSILSHSIDMMMDRMADANLMLDKPDVIVAPLVGHYHPLDHVIPTDLRERGYIAMQLQLGQLEKSLDFVKTLVRVAKYVDRTGELQPTVKPLAAPQERNQG
jgi:NTE family protein